MSFILDALRKSEHDRERRTLPGLVERPVAGSPPSKLPFVLIGLGLLLLVNFIVLGIVLFRSPSGPAPVAPTATPAAAVTQAPVALPAAPHRASDTVPRTRPLDAEAADADAEAADAAAEAPPGGVPEPTLGGGRIVTATRPTGGRLVQAPSNRATDRPVEQAPAINDLPEQVASGLPHVNVDLHVYADAPAERFVVVNGQRLREGGQLREGPTLERITPDGVILSYRGTRFLVPRQQ